MSHPKRPPRPLRHAKQRGEWAEMKFALDAAARGLIVLKPYGDCAPFDFVVSDGRHFQRVQVKSAWTRHKAAYFFHCRKTRSFTPYTRTHIDFFAFYVKDFDAWYIVPARKIGRRRVICLFPHSRRGSRSRLEPYRDAWHLLFAWHLPTSFQVMMQSC